jgi:tetratricopeptide (TPR) repeat protein
MERENKTRGSKILRKYCLRFIAFAGTVFFLFLPFFSANAVARVIDNVIIKSQETTSEIHIEFNLLFQYVTHTPRESGDALQIRLRPVLARGANLSDYQLRETLSWGTSADLPLQEILYEGDFPTGPRLSLRFAEPVSFAVQGKANLQGVVVIVKKSIPVRRTVDQVKLYAINLESFVDDGKKQDTLTEEERKKYIVYLSKTTKNNQLWHRLRIGFFQTREEAEEVVSTLADRYPKAWITEVSENAAQNIKQSVQDRISQEDVIEETVPEEEIIALEPEMKKKKNGIVTLKPDASKKTLSKEGGPPVLSEVEGDGSPSFRGISTERLDSMREEAKNTMTEGNYARAIQLYTRILESPDEQARQEAQELLGLARERNNQLAHARAEYTKYLELYPESEGAERVRQRLNGILTAQAEPKEKLRKPEKSQEAGRVRKDVYGSFAQYYSRDENFTDLDESTLNRSSLISDFDFTTRFRSDTFDVRSLAVVSYERDFTEDEDHEFRASSLYLDWLLTEAKFSGRLGRQSLSSSGVLGRFDGGLLSYEVVPRLTVNTVFGYPVDTSSSGIDTDRYFYGVSADLGTFADHWDFNTFIINQVAESFTDRRAVGGEVRYFDMNTTAFSLIDYDIYYNMLNLFIFTGNHVFPNRATVNISYDYRKSPLMTTTNAIQGQGVFSLQDLLGIFTEEEIENLARDRTATYRSLILGMTQPINEKLQVSGDVTIAKLSDTPASGGVEAMPETGYEYYYSLQLIGSSLVKEGDLAVLGLRYSDTTRYNSYSFSLNTRYPFSRELRVNPKLVIDYRDNNNDSGEQYSIKPSLRLDYIFRKRFRLELEGGGEWSTDKLSDQTDRSHAYYVIVGYRWDF